MMTDPTETPAQAKRRRLINMGEVIAIAALVISALGLWNSWSKREETPAVVVEKARTIPLALRGKVEDEGKSLAIAPVEAGHSLEELTLITPDKAVIGLMSDPRLSAASVEKLLPASKREGSGTLEMTIEARYIEAGTEREATARYRIAYRWVRGGLLDGPSIRFTGLRRI